jgi:hypothetical protein
VVAAESGEGKMPTQKPEFLIDLDVSRGTSPLKATGILSSLKPSALHHERHDCRHPLGIYNISTSKILRKICKCSEKLEAFQLGATHVDELEKLANIREELLDYLELCLYAAAEHVDDVEATALCFFESSSGAKKSPNVRKLKNAMNPIRGRISGVANAIKHQQSRIRLFSTNFKQAENEVCLHGFYVEKFHGGGISPSPLFHATKEKIISVTSFLWSIVTYLFSMSEALCDFIAAIDAMDHAEVIPALDNSLVHKCIVGLVRLPLYSFDEKHPFESVRYLIKGGENVQKTLDSGIYGSLLRRWSKVSSAQIGPASSLIGEGDGTTRKFALVTPNTLHIQHWD